MVCYFHPDRESTNTCEICGKEICPECGLELAGKVYCKDCIENIVGLNINEKAPETEEPIQEVQEPVAEEISTPVFKDSASIDGRENPYKIIDNEESFKRAPEKVPEVKEFSSKPNIFRESKPIVEKPNSEEKEFIPIEEPNLTSIYEQEKERTLNNLSKPVVNELEENISSIQDKSNEYDVIYPDHTYEPPETSARRALEEKYENYLDDLYFDEEVPLNEQLAQDEKEFGSLTETPYVPIEKDKIPLNELYPEEFGENGELISESEEAHIYEKPIEVVETPKEDNFQPEQEYLDSFEAEETHIYEEHIVENTINEPIRNSVMGAGAAGGIYASEQIIEPQTETVPPVASGVYTENPNLIEDNQVPMTFDNDEDLENEIRRRLASKDNKKKSRKEKSSRMSFLKKDKSKKSKEKPQKQIKNKKIAREIEKVETNKDPVGVVDVLLTILLIIIIVVVVFYLIYIFTLQAYYPTFTDALFGLAEPKTFINNVLHK